MAKSRFTDKYLVFAVSISGLLSSFRICHVMRKAVTRTGGAGLNANGPAVCFSRRNPTTAPGRILVPRASGAGKLSRCKEGLARVFAVMVQILLSSGAIAVQVLSELRTYHWLQSWLGALAQCRDTKLIGARKLSR
jgi:hypothetical protein